ncbi:hypothetical protein [Rhizobium sp. BK251]|uniref:hypothetical protein n=1 Tax=Rhizobium sp. BK251 TaxID=2512125 RepID=UPI0010529209|nr:hypothetical protein [Rhizobium sp. BK251]TCL70313.1 hypothetical protein EV286_107182 [Rhizobium sp. BK251]
MKAAILIAAVLGLSATTAMADCLGHSKVTASAPVDKEMTTASIIPEAKPQSDATVILPDGSKAPVPAKATE